MATNDTDTGIVSGLLAAAAADSVMIPWTPWPDLGGNLLLSTETFTLVGVLPVVGETTSQGWSLDAFHRSAFLWMLVMRMCSVRNTQFRVDPGA